MFTYMALNESVISDHCPAPYERYSFCLLYCTKVQILTQQQQVS